MKGMPLPFVDFQGKKGILDLDLDLELLVNHNKTIIYSYWKKEIASSCFVNNNSSSEGPNSVLHTIRSQSSPSSSTLSSSSLGGGGGGGAYTAGVAAVSGNSSTISNVAAESQLQKSLEMGVATAPEDKCTMEEWESVLPESVAGSPSQDHSILRWIMGDVDDPSMANLNKVLQVGGGGGGVGPTVDYEFNGGFGVVDQGFGADPVGQVTNFMPNNSEKMGFLGGGSIAFNQQLMPQPSMFNPQVLINQHQTQNLQIPSFFMPLPYGNQQEENLLIPPQPKRHNLGPLGGGLDHQIPKTPFSDKGQGLFMGGRSLPPPQGPHHLLPNYLQQKPVMGPKPAAKMSGEEEMGQQSIIDQLFKAAELVQTGNNPLLAQEILARLNHQLSPIGKPFYRTAFYVKEALQLLLHNGNNLNPCMTSSNSPSPFSLIFKIGAYKAFSEISPLVQFANFTCNQALLEALEGFDHIHVMDFDIGYGGQWASFMQELALRNGSSLALKITAFASPSTHDQLELSLIRENLMHFASEINIAFEFEILSIDSLNSASWSLPFRVSENEAIAVNLPISSFSSSQLSLPHVLRFVKQLSPKVVVSVDRGCDRTDFPFPNHVIHALQSYSNLLESLDAVNVNLDALQKIERFLIQPGIEKVLLGRYCSSSEKTQHWRTLFLSSGFSPLTFSNFTESQAKCVVERTPIRGFHVEKRQSSLVLCWQRKELISASAWRC